MQLNRLIKSKELRFKLSEKAKIKSRGYNWEKASKDTFYAINDLITKNKKHTLSNIRKK